MSLSQTGKQSSDSSFLEKDITVKGFDLNSFAAWEEIHTEHRIIFFAKVKKIKK